MHHQLRYLIPCFPQSSAIYDTKNKVPFSKDKVHSVKTRNTQYAHFSRNEPAKENETAEATKTAEGKPVSAKYKSTDC